MLKSIEINGLRGFGELETINFSMPTGETGSGLNIIVGPNNSGKTTITEAIKLYSVNENFISFSEGKRNVKNNNRIDLKYCDNKDNVFEIHTAIMGGSQVVVTGKSFSKHIPFVLPSRRYVNYNMHGGMLYSSDRDNYSENLLQNSKNRSASLFNFESRIFKWQKNKAKFDTVLREIIDDDFDWIIEQSDDDSYYIKIIFSDKSITHTREGVGDGYWSIFTIVDALYDSNENDIIVIDEPELSVHPSLQKKIIKLLEEYSKDRQIIITTHSPYFVSLESLINGGNLIRTFKNAAGNIKTGTLDNEDKKFIKGLICNLNNPHIFGFEAKELFFIEDNIIITEGQEDVVIIPKICNKLNVELNANLFGWGAGGANNIDGVLKMLDHLGYKKVTAIFDGDKKTEYEKCIEKYPMYNIQILFEDDIRDKEKVMRDKKIGVTDCSGNIKKENEQKFLDLIKTINAYHIDQQKNLE